jgi:serine/threonine-protein kinase
VPALARRFEAERRILAGLQHPGIARLLDAGADDGGRPWLAMDYVEGVPITQYVRERALDLDARLDLFARVCEAVHHAHQRLVVHRDLKPSNVLVAEDEHGRPRPVLLDFGIARLLDEEDEGATTLTEAGVRPMTRAYAAPEQLRGEAATTATDVYALGVLLYELLAGRRPFEAPTSAQLEAAILAEEPARPSAVTQAPAIPAARLRGDLDTVVLKALRQDPPGRYASAAALAEDVARHRAGLPVHARPPSLGHRVRLFVRRHPAGMAAGGAVLVLLVAFAVALALQQRATARERDAAETAAGFLADLFAAAGPFSGARQDTLRVRDLLDGGLARVNAEFADQPHVRARLLQTIGEAYIRLGMHPKAGAPLRAAVALRRGQGDPAALAQSLLGLAAVTHSQEHFEESERLAREALALARRLGDPDLRSTAEHAVGEAVLRQNRYEEAEALYRSAIARQRARRGDGDPILMKTELSLARTLGDQGRSDEAEPLYRSLRDRYTRLGGPENPSLIDVLGSMAFMYFTAGRLDEAEAASAQAVAIGRSVRPGSSTLAQLLSFYALVQRQRGRLDEAEALYREALALPPLRPDVPAVPLGGLASVLAAKGDLAGAVAAQEQAVALLRAAGAPSVAYSQIKLAGFLRAMGRYAEAEPLLLAVAAEAPPAGREGHLMRSPVADLVALYEAWGRPDEAERWRGRLDR